MPVNHTYAVSEWRLLNSGFANGPTNMAIDEAILHSVATQNSPPTLRFYGWKPPCLSLGFSQPWEIVDYDYCRLAGWDVVRRPTGGRAILHENELTYSVIAPINESRVRGSVLESYQRLSEALFMGLTLVGVSPAESKIQRSGWKSTGPVCYDIPSHYEITVDGKKLVGSAQVRKKGVILQHGTIPLSGDLTGIVKGLLLPEPSGKQKLISDLRRSSTTLEQTLDRLVEFTELAGKIRQGFEQSLNLVFWQGQLSPLETEIMEQLVKEKYANSFWNRRLQKQAGRKNFA